MLKTSFSKHIATPVTKAMTKWRIRRALSKATRDILKERFETPRVVEFNVASQGRTARYWNNELLAVKETMSTTGLGLTLRWSFYNAQNQPVTTAERTTGEKVATIIFTLEHSPPPKNRPGWG